jgi:hypothetical protein
MQLDFKKSSAVFDRKSVDDLHNTCFFTLLHVSGNHLTIIRETQKFMHRNNKMHADYI